MSKWLNLFLENEIVNRSDKSDRFKLETNMSPLSLCSRELLNEKLEKAENNHSKGGGGDKSARFKSEPNVSPLSLCSRELLDEKLEKAENNHSKGSDKSARFRFETNMSPLSLRPPGLLDEKMVNTPEPDISDRADRSDPNLNLSDLSGSSLLDSFEERLAIAEYDGDQNLIQAHRISYLDTFISVLTALPATGPQRDWLDQRIQTSLAWIETQNFPTLN